MRITLDQDTWEVPDQTPLVDVLSELGDRARHNQRIVTRLMVGGRAISDRDLLPTLLAQQVGTAGSVQAASQTLGETLASARGSAQRFAVALREEAVELIAAFRHGIGNLSRLDRWLGSLADYVEYEEHVRRHDPSVSSSCALSSQLPAILEARTKGDLVCLADLLEYEIVPRLDVERPGCVAAD